MKDNKDIALFSELVDLIYKRGRIKIDLVDLLRQLNTPEAGDLIKRYLTGAYRMHAVLREQADAPARDRMKFVDSNLNGCLFLRDQFIFIADNVDSICGHINNHDGLILDLGIWKGGSTRKLASLFKKYIIHGFDSFKGLPDQWTTSKAGTFSLTDDERKSLDFPENCKIHPGWFDETLPRWCLENSGCISLMRVDCDIYSSTRTIFDNLGTRIVPGTVVIFDELIGYWGWELHEFKALNEFLRETNLVFNYKCFGETFVAGVFELPSDA